MRCGCPNCGEYMVHAESMQLGCVCPNCLYRCKACLGTDSAMSHESVISMKRFMSDTDEDNGEEK